MRITLKAALATLFLAIVAFGAKPDLSATIAKVANLQDQLAKNELILKTERANMPASNLRVLQFEAKKLELQKELDKLYDQLPKELRSQAREQQRQMLQAVLPGMPSSSPTQVPAVSTPSTAAANTKSTASLAVETSHDRLIRLRAEKIELDKKVKAAQKEALKKATPSVRQATKEVESAEVRDLKRKRDMDEAYFRSGLACRDEKDAPAVFIDPDVERKTYGFVNAKYTFFNPYDTPVTIRDDREGKDVVRGLCPGGRITITKMLPFLTDSQIQVSYSVYGTMGGRPAIGHAPQTTLNSYQAQYQATQLVNWEIRLQVIQ
jgi:hypothetical protein